MAGRWRPTASQALASCALLVSGAVAVQRERSVFIFGLGYTGRRLAREITRQKPDWAVAGTVRRQASTREDPRVRELAWDGGGLDRDGLEALAEATHVVSTVPPGADGGDPVLGCVQGILRDTCRSPRLEWIAYTSTTSVYGDHGGRWVTEDSPTHAPPGSRAHARLLVEREWLALGAEPGMNATVHVLRLAGIYGPGRSALDTLRRQPDALAQCEASGGAHPVSRVHVDDICGATIALMTSSARSGVFNVADHDPAPRAQVFSHADKLLAASSLSAWLNRQGSGAARSPTARSTPSERHRRRRTESKRVCGDKLRTTTGYKYVYPDYTRGLAAVAETSV